MSSACARSWEAEAIEDGRLVGAERAAFERHAAHCAPCTAQVTRLAELRAAVARLPVLTSTPFEKRGQRARLLERANQRITGTARPRRVVGGAMLAGAAIAVALGVWAVNGYQHGRVDLRAAATPTYELERAPGSDFRIVETGATLRLAVGAGRFAVHVDALAPGQRFVVALPDGELEVQGTRFVIEAEAARTLRVVVSEGRVALRLQGKQEIVVGEGEEWRGEVKVPSSSPGPGPSPSPSASSSPGTSPSPGATADRGVSPVRKAGAKAKVAPVPEAQPAPEPLTAGAEFIAAESAFSSGDYGRAEQLLLAFEVHHPDDSRVEDATFLRAVARARRGDTEGARVIAREYLRRYPGGLRRLEAERLTR